MTAPYPQTMDFSGHNAPSRIECDVTPARLEVKTGRIPMRLRSGVHGNWASTQALAGRVRA